jgi:hypothetical protein
LNKVQEHYDKIQAAIESALADGVRVHIGGNLLQVTKGTESRVMTTMYVDGNHETGLLVQVPVPDKMPVPLNNSSQQFTGNTCSKCYMAMMIRTGSCETCLNCGDTSSCG